ncbi:MAG TPA: hypothetical protein PLB10_10485 [Thiolinea sp.]|nr:hypothetical protein [Thiolinea sp.]
MKRYLLIFTLLLSFLANGMAGAGMMCIQQTNTGHAGTGHAGPMVSMGSPTDGSNAVGHAHHAAAKTPAGTAQQHPDCDQFSCDSGHACANCLAHCASALMTSIPVLAAQPSFLPDFTFKSRHFPGIHSSLLRPPRFS